jgi:hypothetical protein
MGPNTQHQQNSDNFMVVQDPLDLIHWVPQLQLSGDGLVGILDPLATANGSVCYFRDG